MCPRIAMSARVAAQRLTITSTSPKPTGADQCVVDKRHLLHQHEICCSNSGAKPAKCMVNSDATKRIGPVINFNRGVRTLQTAFKEF